METEMIATHINVQAIEEATATELATAGNMITEIKRVADAMQITNIDESKSANEVLSKVKKYIKDTDATRLRLTSPLREGIAIINDSFNFSIGVAKEIKGIIDAKMIAFIKEQNRIKEEAEKKARALEIEKAKAQQAILEAKAAETNSEFTLDRAIMAEKKVEKLESAPIEVATTVKSYGGSAFIRKTWTYEIINEAIVPREFCTPDEGKLRSAVNAGMRDKDDSPGIPGVRIFEKEALGGRQ